MATKHEPAQGWTIVDHICRVCFSRVLMRQDDGRRIYRCAGCGVEAEGRTEAVICTCGIKLKTGVDAGIRCSAATNPTPEFPSQITASQVAPPVNR
jgi:DNA-directed RNA polymerase subunit RPC12/RpoP